ncbi:ATP-binding protein [Streptomyces sp. NPDC015346]|uniref:ATP-binding protein n=1 Tax=Streptomyces sp. NPDC015346 TaxID=3364954 RepID=UPI0036FBF619
MTNVIARDSGTRRPALSARVDFEGGVGMIAASRDFTADFLTAAPTASREPLREDRVDVARLVVSELVTNVVRHAPGPCRLELALHPDVLEIRVHDTRPVPPVAGPRDPNRIGQHGMEIVLALCTRVDVEATPHGKRIRARLPLS